MGTICNKLVIDTFWGPGLSSHPVLDKYIEEILHYTFILHHNKRVTIGVLPGGRGVGWERVTNGEI